MATLKFEAIFWFLGPQTLGNSMVGSGVGGIKSSLVQYWRQFGTIGLVQLGTVWCDWGLMET